LLGAFVSPPAILEIHLPLKLNTMLIPRHAVFFAFQVLLSTFCFTPLALGQGTHQTPIESLAVLQTDGGLPFTIGVSEVDFGSTEMPTLHSFAAAHYGGKWVLMAGRTSGLHGITVSELGFPSQYQNRDIWVIDPDSMQSWRRTLDKSQGFTEFELNALTPTNNQFYVRGDHLYMIGGYGIQSTDPGGTENFGTFDTLSAVNLPGIIDWVQNGTGAASDNIRIIHDPALKVTGGGVHEINGRTHLVFGQDFDGVYNPGSSGTYTKQVRSFNIVDDGTSLSLDNVTATTPVDEYRRRDLNVFPVLRPDGNGGTEYGITALAGVFTPPPGFGAWTVPVEIDANGIPDPGGLPDPNSEGTFRQGFNGYHAAKLGLFSGATGDMYQIFFGGMSLQQYDPVGGTVTSDNWLPYINNITTVLVDANGNYSHHYLGEFPPLYDHENNLLRFGANAEFFPTEGLSTYDNGVIKLDELAGETTLGYIYGGLVANAPHTRGGRGISMASNTVFRVNLTVASPVAVQPESVATTQGTYLSGGVDEISISDNIDYRIQRANNDIQSRTEFVVTGTSPTLTPARFEVTLEGAVFARGNVVQSIELYDYDLGEWVLVDSQNANRSPSPDKLVTIAATGDLSRFVKDTTREVAARVRYRSDSPRQSFASNTDQFIWMIRD
jgi:hypothetical protein